MTPPAATTVTGADALVALLICGLLGMLGQGIRAIVGLKNANALNTTTPGRQSVFSAAYLLVSLMIGFIAGILAGFVVGLNNFIKLDPSNIKLFAAIAASGYAGADFIENSMSLIITNPATKTTPPAAADQPRAAMIAVAPSVEPPLTAALSVVAPHVSRTTWVPALTAAFAKFDVNDNRREAAAVGQFLVEAGSAFQETVENLIYTSAQHIADVFPDEFATAADAEPYVRNPVGLGNRAYANKLGNGDEASGDGYRYRGRGLIQLTGRDEYAEYAATIGKSVEDAAAYCETPEGAAMSGCWYLSSRGCLPLADAWQIDTITLKVNGHKMEGAAQRRAYSAAMLKQLGG
ncbi:MAG: hypothetical protein ABSD74_15650 [Rhizomicrobium sp.]|jgi:predicted chitinase